MNRKGRPRMRWLESMEKDMQEMKRDGNRRQLIKNNRHP
jgi:hypothetical protein